MPPYPSLTGLSPSLAGFPKTILLSLKVTSAVRTRSCTHDRLPSSAFARRYLRNRCFFLFLALLRCFSSGGSLPYVMDWRMDDGLAPAGFPHSDIPGSQLMCSSPRLFAAYHVFHRLLVPRHPPCALCCLIASPPVSLMLGCRLKAATPSPRFTAAPFRENQRFSR